MREKKRERRGGLQIYSQLGHKNQKNLVRGTYELYINDEGLNYSLYSLLIAIFQKLKCSKMIAIFTISMGIGNK